MGLFTRKSAVNPSSDNRDWELVANIAQNSLIEQRKSDPIYISISSHNKSKQRSQR